MVKVNKRDLHMATQILTGHAALNCRLSKLSRTVKPTCPLCEAEDETVSHIIGQYPMLGKSRAEFLDTYDTTAPDIVDRLSLTQIIQGKQTRPLIGTCYVITCDSYLCHFS